MALNPDDFMRLLSSREQVLQSILADLGACASNAEAFAKLEALYEEGKSVDAGRALRACAKSVRHLNECNRRLLMLLLVYSSGDTFSADAALALSKMGRGEDALRELLKSKLRR